MTDTLELLLERRNDSRRAPLKSLTALRIESWLDAARNHPALKELSDHQLVQFGPSIARLVKYGAQESLGQRMRQDGVSDYRARRLLNASRQDIALQIQRMIPLIGHRGNVADLIIMSASWSAKLRSAVAKDYFSPAL